ncbi:hypothetical protein N9Q43_00295 [bacterium]|nr:hypothetical protein [bacterium]
MSKYNLTDIFEQYQIGSGWTNDFDYEGMLNSGLKTGVDTDIEILRKMSDDFEDVNYHRENNHLQKAIDALEEGAIKEASMFFGDFHAEIKSTMETFDMDIEPTLGKFMASKMEEGDNEEEMYDVVDKASGEMIDDDLPKRMALALAAKKKGWVTKKSQKKKMNEVRIDRDVADKIEGMLSRPLKAQFLDAFDDLWEDLTEDDMFYPEDVINHLHNEMHKRLRLYRTPDPKPEEIPMFKGTRDALDDISIREEGAMQPGEADLEAGVKGNMDAFTEGKGVDFIRALKVDANGTKLEIKSYLESLKRSGDKFDSIDDYVEDFKNYVADKSLQEHFGRFMKDYQ